MTIATVISEYLSDTDRVVTPDEPLRIALDMESVLVDTFGYFLPVYNNEFGTEYERHDIDNWHWVRTEIEMHDFNRIVNEGWRDCAFDPAEDALPETVSIIGDDPRFHIDVVTARTGVDSEMLSWLSKHEITEFNNFHSVDVSKATLDYELFIDDNPTLVQDLSESQFQIVIAGPHNLDVNGHRAVLSPSVRTAVDSVVEAVERRTQTQQESV